MAELAGLVLGFSADQMLDFYRQGYFPMPVAPVGYGLFSPSRRAVLPLENLRVTRSLRQSMKHYGVTFDKAFADVLAQCAGRNVETDWIDDLLIDRYTELHHRGYAHSVEVWDGDGNLCGGLFAVNIGGLVSGESMFHVGRDASKVALVHLVRRLRDVPGPVLLDAQYQTPHLASLGVVQITRRAYHGALRKVVSRPNVL